MTRYFSASRVGFFDTGINLALFVEHDVVDPLTEEVTGTTLVPDPNGPIADAVEITDGTWRALLDAESAGKVIVADSTGHPIAIDPPAPPLDQYKATLCAQVDASRDGAYAAIGGNNAGRIEEYTMARDDAIAYRAAGYAGAVPVGVSSWVTPERTAQQAADGIIATADAWTAFVGAVRTYTLQGKYAVTVAADAAGAHAAADQAIASIEAAVAYAMAQTAAAEAG